jgi:hypothetical protein
MSKKIMAIGTAIAFAFALAVVATGDEAAVACDKKEAKTTTASSKSCTKSASAAKVASTESASSSCCAAKTASAKVASSKCTRSASAAKVASSGCSKSTAALASSCDKSASARTASSCDKSASARTASSCNKAAGAKLASGCCAGKAAVAGYSKEGKAKAKETPEEHAAALKAVVDEVPAYESRRVVVTGTMACGHCSLEATATCAPLLKTTDGKVYPLAPSQMVKNMRHSDAAQFHVTSRVKNLYGVKYLDVQAFDTL